MNKYGTEHDKERFDQIHFTPDGWSSKLSESKEELKAYFYRRNEITFEQGTVYSCGVHLSYSAGKCKSSVLEELHAGQQFS